MPLGGKKSELPVFGMALLAAGVFGAMYLSSLVDWFYTGPRLRGDRDRLPCMDSLDPAWRTLTRYWLLHRVIAALIFVAAAVAIVAIAANRWVIGFSEVVAGVLAAAATIMAGFYLTRFAFAFGIVVNPPLQIGDRVQLAEPFSAPPLLVTSYYVVDIAVEGIKLLELEWPNGVPVREDQNRTYDRVLDLADVHKLLRVRARFDACNFDRCCEANPYCCRITATSRPDPRYTGLPRMEGVSQDRQTKLHAAHRGLTCRARL